MITITQAAAERIRQAATESGVEPPLLRLAAQVADDGTVDFGMGFDQPRPGDTEAEVEGVRIVVAERSRELVEGVTLDFVEIEPGELRFVFVRPGQEGEA